MFAIARIAGLRRRRQRTEFRLQLRGAKFRLARPEKSQEFRHAFARLRRNVKDFHSGPNRVNISVHSFEIKLRGGREIELCYDGDVRGIENRGIF
jgi:hypothetical protein